MLMRSSPVGKANQLALVLALNLLYLVTSSAYLFTETANPQLAYYSNDRSLAGSGLQTEEEPTIDIETILNGNNNNEKQLYLDPLVELLIGKGNLAESSYQLDGLSPPVNNPADFGISANYIYQQENNNSEPEAGWFLNYAPLEQPLFNSAVEAGELQNSSGDDSKEMNQQTSGDPNSRGTSSELNSVVHGGEYIDHPLALIGHQYVQGGAGEGRQLLGPDGSFENVQVIKTDRTVPSYCNPPNPCPIGFTSEDGCLENFVNSASFSREYQAKQQCSCDNEHSLFNCAAPPTSDGAPRQSDYQVKETPNINNNNLQLNVDDDNAESIKTSLSNKLDTLARSIQNRYGNLESIKNLIGKHDENGEENLAGQNNENYYVYDHSTLVARKK